MARTLFSLIEAAGEQIIFELKVSFVEIYLEKVRDLLDESKTDLQILDNKLNKVTEVPIESE